MSAYTFAGIVKWYNNSLVKSNSRFDYGYRLVIIRSKKDVGIAHWFVFQWDWLVSRNDKITGAVVRFRWVKGRQRQWNIEFYKV